LLLKGEREVSNPPVRRIDVHRSVLRLQVGDSGRDVTRHHSIERCEVLGAITVRHVTIAKFAEAPAARLREAIRNSRRTRLQEWLAT